MSLLPSEPLICLVSSCFPLISEKQNPEVQYRLPGIWNSDHFLTRKMSLRIFGRTKLTGHNHMPRYTAFVHNGNYCVENVQNSSSLIASPLFLLSLQFCIPILSIGKQELFFCLFSYFWRFQRQPIPKRLPCAFLLPPPTGSGHILTRWQIPLIVGLWI